MYVWCLGTPAHFKWPGEHIYIGLKLKRAVWSCCALLCESIGTSGAGASVLPVTMHSEVVVGFSDTVAAIPGTIG